MQKDDISKKEYEQFKEKIIVLFKDSIITKDENIKRKILNSMIEWYQRTYDQEVKHICRKSDKKELIPIINEINNICKSSDILKLKLTYQDNNFDQFRKLSEQIFFIVKKSIETGKVIIEEGLYQKYCQDLNDYEMKISPVFYDDYQYTKSECLLDLEYLKNRGKTDVYSFRLHNHIRLIDKRMKDEK